LDKKRLLLFALAFLMLILLFWYVGFQQIISNLQSTNVLLLVIAALLHSFSILLRGVRWKYILASSGTNMNTLSSFGLIYVGWFANSLVPAKAGDIVRAFAVRKESKCPLGRGLASLVTERIFDAITIVVLVLVSILLVSRASGLVSSTGWVAFSITIGAAIAIGLLVFAVLCIKKQSFVARIFSRLFGSKYAKETKGFTRDLGDMFACFLSSKGLVGVTILLSAAIWITNFPKFYIVFTSLNLYPDLAAVAVATFVSDAWGMVPLTPGGIGSVEIGQTIFIILIVGLATPVATAVMLLDRLVSFYVPMLIGGIVSVKKGVSFTVKSTKS